MLEQERQGDRPLTLPELQVLSELSRERRATTTDLAHVLQRTEAETRNHLARMVERGWVEARGERKGRTWRLMQNPAIDPSSSHLAQIFRISPTRRARYEATTSPADRKEVTTPNPSQEEKPLRFERISGLNEEQLDELECRVAELLEESWDKGQGRPRGLTLREALVVACGYLRQNIIEDVWADIFDVHQSTISRYITFLTPVIEKSTEEDRPTEKDATEATQDAIALVDGTLWPCWSWDGEDELWAGKYKTTGHGSLIITNLQGRVTFVSDPVTGNQHDMTKLKGSVVEKILKKAGGVFGDKGFIGTDYITTPIRKPTCRKLLPWEHEWNTQVSSFRAPVERAVATLKTWRILFTDYRRPLKTFKPSFHAAIGLYFFKEGFA
ncbi:MAG: transposase family protein [Pseudonocardiaceae bacterium]